MSKQVEFNNLNYCFKDQNIAPINFISFKISLHIYNGIKIVIHQQKREKVIKLCNDYAKIISETMYKTKQEIGLGILTSKQMFQRLPIALAQGKAGNSSENLLNEISQIVVLCINQNKLLKKYIRNIIKSIQI